MDYWKWFYFLFCIRLFGEPPSGGRDLGYDERLAFVVKADAALDGLEQKIKSYLEFRKKEKEANELLLKEIGLWDQWDKQDQKFLKNAAFLRDKFLSFRKALEEFILEQGDHSPYAALTKAAKSYEATEWYIELFEKIAFPERWGLEGANEPRK